MSWLPPQRKLSPEEMIQGFNASLGDGLGGTATSALTPVGAAVHGLAQPSARIPSIDQAGGVLLGNTYGSAMGVAPTPVLDTGQPLGGPDGTAGLAPVNVAAAAPGMPGMSSTPVDDRIRAAERLRLAHAQHQQGSAEGGLAAAKLAMLDARDAGADAAADVAGVEGNVEGQKAQLQNEANAQQAADLQEFRSDRAVMERQIAQAQKKADYLATQAASAEMKDFWADKSTGSRIMGILAQTLSGAANGLAGQPGAPSALDRIIERDFELQKRNLSHKTESAQAAAGALGQIYNNYSNKQQAYTAMQMSMVTKVKQEISALDSQMKSDTSAGRAAQMQAQMDQKQAELQAKIAQEEKATDASQATAASNNLVQMRGQDIQKDMYSQADLRNLREIPGLEGVYKKDYMTESAKKKMVAYGESLTSLEQMRATVHDPAGFANLVQGGALESMMRGGARERLGVGANVQGKEAADMEAIIQSFLKGKAVDQVSPQTFDDMINALERVAGTGARGVVGASVPNAAFDESHPVFGRAWQLSRPRAAPAVAAK